MRRETKFTFPHNQLFEVKNSLLNSNFIFDKAFPDRRVCSLYFDTPNFDDFCDNVTGISERCKLRIRWYPEQVNGDTYGDDQFQLELKLKKNRFGEKLTHHIKIPTEFLTMSGHTIVQYILQNVPLEYRPLIDPCSEVTLGVSYMREYYISRIMDLRCTIDCDLHFWDPRDSHTLKPQFHTPKYITEYDILELKFPADLENNLPSNFEAVFPGVSVGRHSKYAVGCSLIYA